MKYTPLIIKNNSSTATGQPKIWNELNNVQIVIKSIPAAAVVNKDGNKNSSTGKIISGIPTPWARATIFKYALQEKTDGKLSQGLKDFYDKIKVEWRSLIAFIALHSEDIKVEKIELNGDVSNPSNFKARLGSMLFEEKGLWDDPTSGLADNPPYIQLVKYKVDKNKYVTIGATSPYTILFTPPKVKSTTLSKFIKRGDWVEPTKCDLNTKELQKIYDTVTYMRDQLGHFNELINNKIKTDDLKLNSASLDTMLKKYQQDLKGHSNGRNIKDFNIFNAPKSFFKAPFDILFNAEAKLYQEDGRFYRKRKEGSKAFKVEDFLAPSKNAVEIIFKTKEGENPIKNTAHLLEIKLKDKDGRPANRYFAIPLSDIGIIFFQNKLDLLLDESTDIKHQLKGTIENSPNGAGKRLKVELTIEYYAEKGKNDKDTTTVERSYDLPKGVKLHEERIIVWPNFVSTEWKKYYLYSDLPHNLKDNEVKAFPLLGTVNDDKSIVLRQDHDILSYIDLEDAGENTNITGVKIPVKNLVNSPNRTLNYEIYESEFPFLGVELRVGSGEQKAAGYLISKSFSKTAKQDELKLEYKEKRTLKEATVGIDFGSNNTCISFSSKADGTQKLVTLYNRRRFFMGSERSDNKNVVANAMELFFFNKSEMTGQLKSMLVAHDTTRLADSINGNSEAVKGGFPIIENNLPISLNKMVDADSKYKLDIKETDVNVIHNMKWSPDPAMNNYKYSFLKTLWLQTNAELYDLQHKPVMLRWAYPAAMGDQLRNNYRIMWKKVANDIKPINISDVIKTEELTEGSAVATYAIKSPATKNAPGGRLAVGIGNMGIGYDVGGSTTDILILIKKDNSTSPVLAKQSSILLAAQYLSKAIKRSSRIQEVLRNFLNSKEIEIYGIEKMNNDTAPYFLNAVFDRLSATELQDLYGYLYMHDEKRLFAIVSYVSGLILYYTGQLAARVILEEDVDVDFISKGIYGKGGNIFNWTTTVMPEQSKAYYQECFFAGLGKTKELDKKIADLKNTSNTSNKASTPTKNIKDLKAELNALENAFKVFPNDAIKQQIEDLQGEITMLEETNNTQDNIDIATLIIKKGVLEKEFNTLKETAKTVKLDAITNRINELQEELKDINSILEKENLKDSNQEKLKGLESIQRVVINSNVEYHTNFKENKSEVSYGLSSDTQINKLDKDEAIPEIVGEEGYTLDGQPLKFTDVITEEHLKSFGGKFKYPKEFKKLEEFTTIYCDFVSKNGMLKVENVTKAVKELSKAHFQGYVQDLPQFSSAKRGATFDFKSPMIILEGMCLLDRVILEELF
jgi:hypothetical protein